MENFNREMGSLKGNQKHSTAESSVPKEVGDCVARRKKETQNSILDACLSARD